MKRVHPKFRLTVIPTGRLAASTKGAGDEAGFNPLAVPKHSAWGKRIRKAIIAPPGYLFGSWDYNQLEMRIAAHVSRDPSLLNCYLKGIDVHALTAQNIFGVLPKKQDESLHRLPAKTTGFGIIMGISSYGLHQQLVMAEKERQRQAAKKGEKVAPIVWTQDDCERFIKGWLDTYPGVREFQKWCKVEAERTGVIRDFYGRRFLVPQVWCANWKIREHALRQAHALPVQSGAQVVVKSAMARIVPLVRKAMKRGVVYPILQVHDELDFEVREKKLEWWHQEITLTMEHSVELSLPIKAEGKAGVSWGQLEKINKPEAVR